MVASALTTTECADISHFDRQARRRCGYQFALDSAFILNGIQGDIGFRSVW
jgi:hypothetical protein